MRCILLIGKFSKTSEIPFDIYHTIQNDFAEVLAKFFQKVFFIYKDGKLSKNAKEKGNVIYKKSQCLYSLFCYLPTLQSL